MILVGASETRITPPLGVELVGYGPDLMRRAERVLDDLFAQAIVLRDGSRAIVLLSTDLFGISAEVATQVREKITRLTGISADSILIAASHSHTAPTAISTRAWGKMDENYVRSVVDQLGLLVVDASKNVQPSRLVWGQGENRDVAYNRVADVPDDAIDPELIAIGFREHGGASTYKAIVVSYACHPVVLGPKPEVSADFPGALRSYLTRCYPGAIVLFFNGACGDIDPSSNRERWGSGTHRDVVEISQALGKEVERVLDSNRISQSADPNRLRVSRAFVNLEYDLPDVEVLTERVRQLESEAMSSGNIDKPFGNVNEAASMPNFWLGHYKDLLSRVQDGTQMREEPMELQRIDIGETLSIIAIPAEVYAEQGLLIKRQADGRLVIPVCYANGLVGYLPPMVEYDRGSYPATLAPAVNNRPPFIRGTAEKVTSAIIRLLANGDGF